MSEEKSYQQDNVRTNTKSVQCLGTKSPTWASLYINFVTLLPLKLCVKFEWSIVNGSANN